MPLWAFGHLIGRPYASFCDNDAARYALIKGYGKDEGINSLLATFWTAAATTCSDPWFERVSSKANISDGISRDDFSLCRANNWPHIELDMKPIWPILLRALDSIEFACSQACKEIMRILQQQVSLQTSAWKSMQKDQ